MILRARAVPARPGFAACLVLAGAIGLSVATENCTSVRFRSRGSVVLDAPVHGFQFQASTRLRLRVAHRASVHRGSRLRPYVAYEHTQVLFQRTPKKILLYLQ